jgi:tetratricopeptide (TPR) repeat protein
LRNHLSAQRQPIGRSKRSIQVHPLICSAALLLTFCAATAAAPLSPEPPAASLLAEAAAAERAIDPARALELYLLANQQRPDDPEILRSIARQYSDLTALGDPSTEQKRKLAEQSLRYALRAYELDPEHPVTLLSLAIVHGKLALYANARDRVAKVKLIKDYAERSLAADPSYDWAHHVLGRWHLEVAAVSGSARFFARLLFGGLPGASVEQAIAHFEQAARLSPASLAHSVELGHAYLAAGRADDARRALERAADLTPRSPHDFEILKRRSEALARLGSESRQPAQPQRT